jgi:hypothetical protein
MPDRTPARAELDEMLEFLLKRAQQMLKEHEEFAPFGNVMSGDGQISATAGYDGSETLEPQELMDRIVAGMRRQAKEGQIRAAGLCFDVRIKGSDPKPSTTIAVALEFEAGDSVLFFQPYTRARLWGLRFSEPMKVNPMPKLVFLAE